MQPLFESFSGPLLKSGVGRLARYGNYQEIVSNRCILHLTQDWSGPWRGHYSTWTQINVEGQTGPLLITLHLPFKINLSFIN